MNREDREILWDWAVGLLGLIGNWATFLGIGYVAYAMLTKHFPMLTKEQVVTVLFFAAVVWIRPGFDEKSKK